jgi:hypothetical protein
LEESALLTGQEPDIEGSIDMIRAALLGVAVALVQTAEVQAEYFPRERVTCGQWLDVRAMRFNGYSPEEVQAVLKVQTFFAGYIVAFSDLSDLREIIGLAPEPGDSSKDVDDYWKTVDSVCNLKPRNEPVVPMMRKYQRDATGIWLVQIKSKIIDGNKKQ